MSETILLVEDEPLARWAACRALHRCGYVVVEAHNAAQAMACVAALAIPFSLFIIDALLPGALGSEVAALLRRSHPRTPVLYLSGYEPDVLDISQLETQNSYVLPHSFSASQLISCVRQILARQAFIMP